ncbi:MAG: rhamnulokinase family protein [Bacteroidales bacterium]|nr:rhamnulokinase family protein [Bacteroidales bacterium]
MKNTFLAADFGGGSGRVMAGYIQDGRLVLEEIHRFGNRQVRIGRHVYWDFPALFEDMKEGIRKAAKRTDLCIKSIGVDTWGVDFGFVDAQGNLLGLPVCYRDERTAGLCEEFIQTHDVAAHYGTAGIQMMDINSIYQLIAMKREGSPILDCAAHLLFTPDLFSFFLTGEANCEYSIASTSELLDARQRNWNYALIDSLGLRREMFPPIVMPGTVRGHLTAEVAADLGLTTDVKVIAVGSHDTQSASFASAYKMATVPDASPSGITAFLSSGTWSLLGVALDEPVLTEEARLAGCSNEGGILLHPTTGAVEGGYNFLQNITGLWFLQRLMAEWEKRGENVAFDVILPAAEAAKIDTIVDVDDPIFANPRCMEDTILSYCAERSLQVPATIGETVRVVLQSLAHRYAKGIRDFNALLPTPVRAINIIGGGSRNALLNRLASEATGLPVIAGPVEATGIGNILLQALTTGEITEDSNITIE